ncbi:hypothetical protein I4U23_004208 [Adineta vaga]|nr:hypothetical protein I4U23_004208 [Adineta vaga]
MVEPRIKNTLIPKKLLFRPCAVIIRRTGAGKTTVVNALCGTKHAAGEGKGNITRNLFRNDVSFKREYSELISSIQSASSQDKDEILHITIVQFKDEMETLLEDFRHEHESAMHDLDYYTFYIKMEKENVRICDEFVEKVVPLMSYNLFDNQDPRNLIKRCPNCQLIWFKTEGCDGQTTCGRRGFSDHTIFSSKAFWKYQLKRIGGKLHWEKNPVNETDVGASFMPPSPDLDENDGLDLEENRPESFMKYIVPWPAHVFKVYRRLSRRSIDESTPDSKDGQRVGCGKSFVWSKLPKIEDELILELFKVKTIDQAKQLIEAGNFKEARQNYDFEIDSAFHY